jgi:hypothetical protein
MRSNAQSVGQSLEQTPSLPVPRPAGDATREKQIPFRPRMD